MFFVRFFECTRSVTPVLANHRRVKAICYHPRALLKTPKPPLAHCLGTGAGAAHQHQLRTATALRLRWRIWQINRAPYVFDVTHLDIGKNAKH